MSDAAFRNRGQTPLAAEVPDLAQHYVPKSSSLFGGDRMGGVNSEREAASAQMQRSLKAWRKAKDDDAPQSYVPQASGGKPLPTDVRKKMEPRLGADLSSVRMHDSGETAHAANKLGARAFTVGSDVHFNSGEFNPGTREGDKLIAHELTHVVQGQKAGVQRKEKEDGKDAGGEHKADAGEEHEGKEAEVSEEGEPAEQEAEAKSEEVAGGIHDDEKKDKDDKKKDSKDKKDAKDKTGLDAANEEDEKKKKGGDEGAEAGGADEKKDDVKEAAPAKAAKLFRKVYLGGRQAKPKPNKPLPAVDPKVREEMEIIKAAIEKDAAKTKTLWSAVAVPVGTILVAAGKGAGAGLVGGPVGAAIGGAAGAVVGAAISIFGIGHAKHKAMEQKAELLEKIDLLVHQPEVIHEIYDYCRGIEADLKVIQGKADEAIKELSNKKKKLAEKDKKSQDKKKGPAPGPSGAEEAGHKGHKAHSAVEVVEAGAETGAAAAEAGAHGLGEAAAHLCEMATPVLEGVAEVAGIAGPAVGAFVAGCDFKAFTEKSKKLDELKAKADGAGAAP